MDELNHLTFQIMFLQSKRKLLKQANKMFIILLAGYLFEQMLWEKTRSKTFQPK